MKIYFYNTIILIVSLVRQTCSFKNCAEGIFAAYKIINKVINSTQLTSLKNKGNVSFFSGFVYFYLNMGVVMTASIKNSAKGLHECLK